MRKYVKKILLWINLFLSGGLCLAYLANYINPELNWQLAFFGLAYPVLLVGNFVFVIIWVWRRKKLAFISILCILAGWSNMGRYFQVRFSDRNPGKQATFKVFSYNVRLFNRFRWNERTFVRDSILSEIKNREVDIICFQEYFSRPDIPEQSEEYIDSLLGEYAYRHIHYTSKYRGIKNFGIATYSKFPILKKGRIQFKNSYNTCIYTDFKFGEDTLRVFNVHLQSINLRKRNYNFLDSFLFDFNPKRIDEVRDISGRLRNAYILRARQVDEVSRLIRLSPYPVVVCGDFNDTPVSYTYQKIRGDLKDAFVSAGKGIGNTYRGNFPSFRIDFIFHSKELQAGDYKTNLLPFSDHYPVSCVLNVIGD